MVQRIREAIADLRFAWGERSFAIGVSIGMVPIGPLKREPGPLLAAADAAC